MEFEQQPDGSYHVKVTDTYAVLELYRQGMVSRRFVDQIVGANALFNQRVAMRARKLADQEAHMKWVTTMGERAAVAAVSLSLLGLAAFMLVL